MRLLTARSLVQSQHGPFLFSTSLLKYFVGSSDVVVAYQPSKLGSRVQFPAGANVVGANVVGANVVGANVVDTNEIGANDLNKYD